MGGWLGLLENRKAETLAANVALAHFLKSEAGLTSQKEFAVELLTTTYESAEVVSQALVEILDLGAENQKKFATKKVAKNVAALLKGKNELESQLKNDEKFEVSKDTEEVEVTESVISSLITLEIVAKAFQEREQALKKLKVEANFLAVRDTTFDYELSAGQKAIVEADKNVAGLRKILFETQNTASWGSINRVTNAWRFKHSKKVEDYKMAFSAKTLESITAALKKIIIAAKSDNAELSEALLKKPATYGYAVQTQIYNYSLTNAEVISAEKMTERITKNSHSGSYEYDLVNIFRNNLSALALAKESSFLDKYQKEQKTKYTEAKAAKKEKAAEAPAQPNA